MTFLGDRKLQLAEFPDPVPGPREVVIEIKASSMCGSDLKFYRAAGGTSSDSWTFSKVGQADCARFIVDRGIAVDRLFTHRWQLAQAEEAYRLFDRQTSGKGVLIM